MEFEKPKVLIDLKEYEQLKSNNNWLSAKKIELESELRKAHRTINAQLETIKQLVKEQSND